MNCSVAYWGSLSVNANGGKWWPFLNLFHLQSDVLNFSYSLVQTMKIEVDCESLTHLVQLASVLSVWHLFGSFLSYAYFIKMHYRHIFPSVRNIRQ